MYGRVTLVRQLGIEEAKEDLTRKGTGGGWEMMGMWEACIVPQLSYISFFVSKKAVMGEKQM